MLACAHPSAPPGEGRRPLPDVLGVSGGCAQAIIMCVARVTFGKTTGSDWQLCGPEYCYIRPTGNALFLGLAISITLA